MHRKHLRRVVGIRWPERISNDKLYSICNTQPLSEKITRLRWKLFGHVLRLDLKTPAQVAMDYYCSSKPVKNGRAETTLPTLLFNEFHMYKQSLKKSTYRQSPKTALNELRKNAKKDKDGSIRVWQNLFEAIVLMRKSCILEVEK